MAITPKNKTKLKMMHLSIDLILSIIDIPQKEEKEKILEVIVSKLSLKNLL